MLPSAQKDDVLSADTTRCRQPRQTIDYGRYQCGPADLRRWMEYRCSEAACTPSGGTESHPDRASSLSDDHIATSPLPPAISAIAACNCANPTFCHALQGAKILSHPANLLRLALNRTLFLWQFRGQRAIWRVSFCISTAERPKYGHGALFGLDSILIMPLLASSSVPMGLRAIEIGDVQSTSLMYPRGREGW